MDRDREAFFADRPTQGRPWPGGFFQNAPPFERSFPEADSLASAFRSPRFGMGNFPGDTDSANSMHNNNMKNPRSNYQQKYSNSSNDADKHFPQNEQSHLNQPRPSSANNPDSIPIRVVYTDPKKKYTSDGRNTTEIPVRTSSNLAAPNDITQGENSPRLERAHSEPPKTFNQKLRAAGNNPGAGGWFVPGTIPENSESFDGQGSRNSNPQPQQHHNLSEPHNNLSTSASAPSVPSHPNRPCTAPPTAPPRRSVPTRVAMNNEPPPQNQRPHEETPAVRHIPIFVEGRDEPVFNKKLSNSDLNQRKGSDGKVREEDDSNIRKPSDFYPTGTKKVSRGATHPLNLDVSQRHKQEPTSPLSPPTGPIPMGYDPNVSFEPPKDEPTSPQPCPPGPIPMSYIPNSSQQPLNDEEMDQKNSSPEQNISTDHTDNTHPQISNNTIELGQANGHNSRKTSVENNPHEGIHIVPITIKEEDKPTETKAPPCEKKEEEKPVDPSLAKLQKVKNDVAELVQKIESYKGSKEDREYKYLDEMLTRHLCTLDSIEAGGRDDIRQMRKATINSINRCASMLDARASGKMAAQDAEDNNSVLDALAAKSNEEEKK